MIGVIFMGIILGLAQTFGRRLFYREPYTSQWIRLYFDRVLFSVWLLWGVISFFWLFGDSLRAAPWSYPIAILMTFALLWLLFKNFWLGWLWLFRHSSKKETQVFWQGKLMKIERPKVNTLLISDGEQQVEIPYTAAENLVSNYEKGKKKKHYKASFTLAPQFSTQHGIELEIKKQLLQSPWSLPSMPPKVVLDKSQKELIVLLEVPAPNMQNAKKMVDIVKKKYEANQTF